MDIETKHSRTLTNDFVFKTFCVHLIKKTHSTARNFVIKELKDLK